MEGPLRILHVINELNSGGAEALIMNWYRNIDHNLIQFDFLLRNNVNIYEKEISQYGGKVFVMPSYPRHYFKNYKQTYMFLKTHPEYRIIHVHGNALIYTNIFNIAKRLEIPCRIMHSHNTKARKKLYEIVHYFHKISIEKNANYFFACSRDAGNWMFPSKKFQILNNGINLNLFQFDEKVRNDLREELNLKDKIIVGHVGRFLASKNHSFLIDVFKEYSKKNKNAILMLIGDGPLENEIKRKIQRYSLEDKVKILGFRDDVYKLMNIMDIFVFPSFFEGLGIVLIEAQAEGLPCLVSNKVPNEAKKTDILKFLSLDDSPQKWANEIDYCLKTYKRHDMSTDIQKNKYDIKDNASELQNFYLKIYNEEGGNNV